MELAGKSLVIVGGTGGLGLSAARACIAAGANVLVVGRDDDSAASASETLGAPARVLLGDATDPLTAMTAVQQCVREFGGFDGLYHVAGGSGRKAGDGPLHELTDDGWEYTCHLNLTSLIYSNRAAVRQFLAQQSGGSVLNISSALALSPSPKYFATHGYAAAKAAVIGLTRSAASYYAPHNIRFNYLVPGLVETPMSQRAQGDVQVMSFIRTKQPLDGGRIARPQDLDAAVVFFLSDASKFVTGQALTIDGGWSVTEGQYQ